MLDIVGSGRAHDWRFGQSVARGLVAGLIALLGFVAVCLAVRLFIPRPLDLYAEIRSEKLALARRWAPSASIAAFGSSHVDIGFDPRAFDKALTGGQTAPVSVNLGVSGGAQTEQTLMAEEFERLGQAAGVGARPHLLLMEVNSGANFPPQFLTHPRAINIYDFATTRLALGFADPQLGRTSALGRVGIALASFGLNFMNAGMLSSQVFPASLNAGIVKNQTIQDRRGLSPPPSTTTFRQPVDRPKGQPVAVKVVLTPGLCAEVRALERGGYRVVYFATPKLTDLQSYSEYPSEVRCGATATPIINVSLPLAHPELYDQSLWYDLAHFNERGAAVYSRLLGEAVRERGLYPLSPSA